VLAIKVKAYGSSHSKVAITHEQIGQALERKGDLPRALDAFRRTLDIRTAAQGADHALTLRVVGRAGQVLARLERCREARPLLARAIDGLTKAGLNPEGTADALVATALCDLAEHQPAQALAHLERASAIAARLDADPAMRGTVDWHTARALAALGRRGAAIALARKAAQEMAGDPDAAADLAAVRSWLAAHRR
jgi:tetratricopeptide (TPR) repeat protein